jgi:shikimate kinase
VNNIVLCGFMGCGKTTVGTALARKLGLTFIDMDEYITAKAGMSVSEIFSQFGETHFRALESQAAAELSQRSGLVISTGGGAVLNARNVACFKSGGLIVLLDVPLRVIKLRLDGDSSRPLLNRPDRDSAMSELFNKRVPHYIAAADITVQNSENIPAPAMAELIAQRIAAL